MMDPIIGHVDLVGGTCRPVFLQLDGRQYVVDDDNCLSYGVWLIPERGIDGMDLTVVDVPMIVDDVPF